MADSVRVPRRGRRLLLYLTASATRHPRPLGEILSLAATGKPVTGIEGHGDHDTIMRATKATGEYMQRASERQRERCAINELWVSTKCGESDTTSG